MAHPIPCENLPEGVTVVSGARLSEYTTFRLGGECPAVVECPTAELLASSAQSLAAAGIDFAVIGQGSNLLVADEGIEQVVLRYCTETPRIEFDGCEVIVSGDTLLDDLALMAGERGLGDISFCSGIPGTVGGAIAGNAGAFGKQIGDVLESVVLLGSVGNVREAAGHELDFSYRSSLLKQTGEIVLSATLRLMPMDFQTLEKERQRILELRGKMHPDWQETACAGSVFRNIEPTSAAERRQAAGWFLEAAGAKDFRVGGAKLFEKHANIIVAGQTATARDVYELLEQMASAVKERFGFDLVREIRLMGNFS